MFLIESAATSGEELGNPVYPPARRKLAEHGIDCAGKTARRMEEKDYDRYDLIVGMDAANLRNMRRFFRDDPEVEFRIANGTEANRKGFAKIRLFMGDRKVERAEIRYRQKNHQFRFGANLFMLDQFGTARHYVGLNFGSHPLEYKVLYELSRKLYNP